MYHIATLLPILIFSVQLEGGFVEPDVNKRWHLPLVNLNATRVEDAIQTRIFDVSKERLVDIESQLTLGVTNGSPLL